MLNLISNLRKLAIDHTMVLTTKRLCRRLQRNHCYTGCVWSSLWDDHPGLSGWNLRVGDMFVMWAQQWRYIARALELGYRVLRADTDVYFAENPYPILHGPLLEPFSLVVQQDFGGPLGQRPVCPNSRHQPVPGPSAVHLDRGLKIGWCGVRRGSALLNVGLLYVRGGVEGGAYAVINGTWAKFYDKLSGPPYKPAHVLGPADPAPLIDQELMRRVVDELAVSESNKPRHLWSIVPGTAAAIYAEEGASCPLNSDADCKRVRVERSRTAFLATVVRPRHPTIGDRAARLERVALAPDWLFGRGCLTHVRKPVDILHSAMPGVERSTTCQMAPSQPERAMGAPGPSAGMLVATHFVYSMALKRKRTFAAFSWDRNTSRRVEYGPGDCWQRSDRGILFGHTFFSQLSTKSVVCAMPAGSASTCACCAGLPPIKDRQRADMHLESTNGHQLRSVQSHLNKLEGCGDYQLFWD